MERYKYAGPTILIGDYDEMELKSGMEVLAEVNINIAVVKILKDYLYKSDVELKEGIYVAAKYLEPVKPEPIHFDPKDDELEHESFNTEDFFDGLNESIKKFPFSGNDNDGGMVRGWDNICQRAWKKKYGDAFHMVPKDEAKKHYKPEDDHEVGGNHYKMAIEPWDFIFANKLDFDSGNVVKYISRHKKKNGAEDVKKAISFCKHILKTQYNEEI